MPDNIWYYRPPDSAQGFDIGSSSKLRFSKHSPCDCMMFNGETLFCIELKTVAGKSISFERSNTDKGVIHHYQIESLKKFSTYRNVVSGILIDFRESNNTYFLIIDDWDKLVNAVDKKSFNESDLLKYVNPILIEKKKLKVNYKYNIEKFIKELRIK